LASIDKNAAPRPNFFVIGAMKSGTSSMHRYLASHPQIFMSQVKEPSYFVAPKTLKRIWPARYAERYWESVDAYLTLFADAGEAIRIGESSTNYAKLPIASGVAERLYRFAPNAKILYIMRDPAERALSHYWHAVPREFEQAPPEKALVPGSHYFDVSHYAMQLAPYLARFPRESVMIVTLEEFEADPDQIFGNILAWLEVDPTFRPPNLAERYFVTPSSFWQTRAGVLARAYRKIEVPGFVRRTCPDPLRYYAWRLGVKPVQREPDRETTLLENIRRWQRPQLRELENLLGRTFSQWTGDS
jgi:hypothetical protein